MFATQASSAARGKPAAADQRKSPFTVAAPKLDLPRGGGAIRGLGEKFAANPVTGTGSMTVPIAASPGRGGFGPKLSLSYDSGSGNGPFGFGWSLDLPRVTRKTDKGLPRYDDASESDVFLLSGVEDLVPVLTSDGNRFEDRATDPSYIIHRYRPRVEGLFAQIERWTRLADGDVHWRSLTRDNILTIYGQDPLARIADSADCTHVFTWLICETRDDKGNAILYEYKSEDGAGIDLSSAHERNRGSRADPRRQVNRYIKRIAYGNRKTMLDDSGRRPRFLSPAQIAATGWLFELVFDYGEHDLMAPSSVESAPWSCRADPFSSCRSGFEVRTSRRCRRALMFHHFSEEADVGEDCLVRSTDFTYADELNPADPRAPIFSFLRAVTQCGYRREGDGYLKRSLPQLEFEYSEAVVQATVQDIDYTSLAQLPAGWSSAGSDWIDLFGEGIPGILTESAGAWYYKRNLSPISERDVEFAPAERVAIQPNFSLADGQARWMDLAGDGQADLVVMDAPLSGFHEHDGNEGWGPFRTFISTLNRNTRDLNLRFVDLDGDGRADVLITEDAALVWHASLGEAGFAAARRVQQSLDEETGSRLVFADGAQSIFLADMNGDGLTDLVRIRNGEVCYWPNLGYARFGAKISMDRAPHFDHVDHFDLQRIRIADIDGSGTSDLIYLASDGITLYFNQSGNGWSAGQRVTAFPAVDNLASIQVADLKGNGTACLVWSSPLPANAMRAMRYVDLMGGQKPHLLIRAVNNLGAETAIHYVTSTKFYLADRFAGTPWISRLPFPVHVVERVETLDRVSGNRFVTRYAYHHGYFDAYEREFRGFGLVEQWDTEELAALGDDAQSSTATNIDASSHVPPVLTRTSYHTGIPVSGQVLPPQLTADEEREASRALKGAMLHQEIYALDASSLETLPYLVTEQSFTIRLLQAKAGNRHAVFFTHARETITSHCERNPTDARVSQAVILEGDDYGNTLKSVVVSYGRPLRDSALSNEDQDYQTKRHITYSEHAFTHAIDFDGDHRAPLPCESLTYELVGLTLTPEAARFSVEELRDTAASAVRLSYEETVSDSELQMRLIEHARFQYRPNDLGAGSGDVLALLPTGQLESLALVGESYKLALTDALVAQRYGGLVSDSVLAEEGRYVHNGGDAHWWMPSGRIFLSPLAVDDAGAELAYARKHFFQPHRYCDPFHRVEASTQSVGTYDEYDLVPHESRDALGNISTLEYDYRLLQPRRLIDPNGNRSEVAFDVLGMVVGTAAMGKHGEEGDSLLGFATDLDESIALAHLADPFANAQRILQRATTRLIYDLFAYQRTRDQVQPQPLVVCAMTRETHDADLKEGESTRIQQNFSYNDGFSREIQRKIGAEPGAMSVEDSSTGVRWVGSGWTIFNNKGKPVREFEPFFSRTHRFEANVRVGVSTVRFYDPLERLVGTLHPNHTWQKVAFDAWYHETWDVNDTVLIADPKSDPQLADFFRRLPDSDYLPTWHELRASGSLGTHERAAALNTAMHAETPSVAYLDALGRTYLTVTHNRFKRSDALPDDAAEEAFHIERVILDIEGHPLEVIDALDRVVMRSHYDMLDNCVHQASMDAGERWHLVDVGGKPVRAWDSRGHSFRTEYDVLQRPVRKFVVGGDAAQSDPRVFGREVMFEKLEYGEGQPNDRTHNLRGRVFRACDGAGVLTNERYDFKGNLIRATRQLASDYTQVPDWSGAVALEAPSYSTSTLYDALNRTVTASSPDGSVIRPAFNEAGLLERLDANLRAQTQDGEPVWTSFVEAIDYDAKGQRERMVYGNGVVTTAEHDPLTFRLKHLRTMSGGTRLQDLSYVHDPVGNLIHIEDDAQPTVFFRNRQVEASNDYLYDSIYRLIEATGREHLGQLSAPTAPEAFDSVHTGLLHPGDGNAMGRYLERYIYDAVGNFLQMQHAGSDPEHPGWTRAYTYRQLSLTEPDRCNNRLSSTQTTDRIAAAYPHDAHGNMRSMPHLPLMQFGFLDQLVASSTQIVNSGTPEKTFYVYGAGGERVRKVTERQAAQGEAPVRMKERVYLGPFEIYRSFDGSGDRAILERETLHISANQQRVAIVETRTSGDDGTASQLTRFQLTSHLGSTNVEVDSLGRIISYEEYLPYGSTSYQALNAEIRAAAKTYRYTYQEHDDETGLYHHGARYYACWLGRWTAADPSGLGDGVNLYAYVRGNPIRFRDATGTHSTVSIAIEVYAEPRPASALEAAGAFAEGFLGGFVTGALFTLGLVAVNAFIAAAVGVTAAAAAPFVFGAAAVIGIGLLVLNAGSIFKSAKRLGTLSGTKEDYRGAGNVVGGIVGGLVAGPAAPVAGQAGGAIGSFARNATKAASRALTYEPGELAVAGVTSSANEAAALAGRPQPDNALLMGRRGRPSGGSSTSGSSSGSGGAPAGGGRGGPAGGGRGAAGAGAGTVARLTRSAYEEGLLTFWANQIHGLLDRAGLALKGDCVEIAMAELRNGKTIFVAGKYSNSKAWLPEQLALMRQLGIRVAPDTPGKAHAEQNIGAYLTALGGAKVLAWSKAAVGERTGYNCEACWVYMKELGGIVERRGR